MPDLKVPGATLPPGGLARLRLEGTAPDGPAIVRFKDADFPQTGLIFAACFALWTRLHIETDLLILLQALETRCADFREVGKQFVPAVVPRDEPQPLRVVKPLHGSSRQPQYSRLVTTVPKSVTL